MVDGVMDQCFLELGMLYQWATKVKSNINAILKVSATSDFVAHIL
jgi:hypothetical protein